MNLRGAGDTQECGPCHLSQWSMSGDHPTPQTSWVTHFSATMPSKPSASNFLKPSCHTCVGSEENVWGSLLFPHECPPEPLACFHCVLVSGHCVWGHRNSGTRALVGGLVLICVGAGYGDYWLYVAGPFLLWADLRAPVKTRLFCSFTAEI